MKKPPAGMLGRGGGSARRSAADAKVEDVSRHSAVQTTDFLSMRALPSQASPSNAAMTVRRATGATRKRAGVHFVSASPAPRITGDASPYRPIPPFDHGRNPPGRNPTHFQDDAADFAGVWPICLSAG